MTRQTRSARARLVSATALAAIAISFAASLLPFSVSFDASASAPRFSLEATQAWADPAEGSDGNAARQAASNDGGNAAPLLAQALKSTITIDDAEDSPVGSISNAIDEAISQQSDYTLAYDPQLIAQIGNQTDNGHWGCCPGYSCAYGDAVIYDVANPHSNYTCRCCTWPGWGGGNSSFRSLGSNQALLEEAYNSIAAGYPTVIHVRTAKGGQHWICLIGYQNVQDTSNLQLGNFVALDPVYGTQINADDGYSLYGDYCEHISDQYVA